MTVHQLADRDAIKDDDDAQFGNVSFRLFVVIIRLLFGHIRDHDAHLLGQTFPDVYHQINNHQSTLYPIYLLTCASY